MTKKPRHFEQLREAWSKQVRADRKLPHAAKTVLWAMSAHLNRESFTAWPSHRTLDKETGMPRRSVQRAIRQAEQRGHIKIEQRYRSRGRQSHIYSPQLQVEVTKVAHEMTPGWRHHDARVAHTGVPASPALFFLRCRRPQYQIVVLSSEALPSANNAPSGLRSETVGHCSGIFNSPRSARIP